MEEDAKKGGRYFAGQKNGYVGIEFEHWREILARNLGNKSE